LEVLPEDASALKQAEMIYQDILFRFSSAFDLNQRRVRRDNSPGTRLEFVQTHLTTARFSECVARSADFRDEELQAGALPVRDVLRLACRFGAGQKSGARQTAGAILQGVSQPARTSLAGLRRQALPFAPPRFRRRAGSLGAAI
jgi:hypothetical protein